MLYSLALRHGIDVDGGTDIDVKMTQQEMADMIFSARENVSIAIEEIAKKGLLEKSRYKIIVKDDMICLMENNDADKSPYFNTISGTPSHEGQMAPQEDLKKSRRHLKQAFVDLGTQFFIGEHEFLYEQESKSDSVYYVEAGTIKSVLQYPDGKNMIISVAQDSFVGENAMLGSQNRSQSAHAMGGDTKGYSISGDIFQEMLFHEPELRPAIVDVFRKRKDGVTKKLDFYLGHDSKSKLSATLLDAIKGKRKVYITHQDLADMIGCARENVTAFLNEFENKQLLTKKRLRIEITNREGLRQYTL